MCIRDRNNEARAHVALAIQNIRGYTRSFTTVYTCTVYPVDLRGIDVITKFTMRVMSCLLNAFARPIQNARRKTVAVIVVVELS